jgi:S-adenosylmethionine hydrolase
MAEDKKNKKTTKKKPVEKLIMGINEFGELTTNINLEEINDFLNKNVDDKKLNEKKK